MLVIRMQRTGRSGHAQFRVVVQDSRRTPTSGKIVASLGHFDPHTKQTVINKEKAQFYLEHGAQPSERAARLLKSEGVKLPKWVSVPDKKTGTLRHPEKLRKNRPAEPKAVAPAAAEASEAQSSTSAEADSAVEAAPEVPAEAEADTATDTAPAEVATAEPAAEAPIEEASEAQSNTSAEADSVVAPAEETVAETEKPAPASDEAKA